MLKVFTAFLMSIIHLNILSGQFYSADVTIDDRLLRSDEKHDVINLKRINAKKFLYNKFENLIK